MTIDEFMRDIAPKMRPGWVAMDGSGQWYFFQDRTCSQRKVRMVDW